MTREGSRYTGLVDSQELREYVNKLNETRRDTSLPRGFRLAPEPSAHLPTPDTFTPPNPDLDLEREDSEYPEPPRPTSW